MMRKSIRCYYVGVYFLKQNILKHTTAKSLNHCTETSWILSINKKKHQPDQSSDVFGVGLVELWQRCVCTSLPFLTLLE